MTTMFPRNRSRTVATEVSDAKLDNVAGGATPKLMQYCTSGKHIESAVPPDQVSQARQITVVQDL